MPTAKYLIFNSKSTVWDPNEQTSWALNSGWLAIFKFIANERRTQVEPGISAGSRFKEPGFKHRENPAD